MANVSFYDLYIINNDWNPNTMLTVDTWKNIERMPAMKIVEKYGKMGVNWYQDDFISLCSKEV